MLLSLLAIEFWMSTKILHVLKVSSIINGKISIKRTARI